MLWDEKMSTTLSIWSTRCCRRQTVDFVDDNLSPVSIRKCVRSSFNWFISDLSHFDSSVTIEIYEYQSNRWRMWDCDRNLFDLRNETVHFYILSIEWIFSCFIHFWQIVSTITPFGSANFSYFAKKNLE